MGEVKVNWVLDKGGSSDDLTSLEEAIRSEGSDIHYLELGDYYREDFGTWVDDACVMFHGSLRMASKIARVKPWIPGPIYDKIAMRCTHYYSLLGDKLINNYYIVCPMVEVDRLWYYYSSWLDTEDLFIRPDCGGKTFTGNVFNQKEWRESLAANLHEAEDDALVIIASPQHIDAEYRFIVIDGKVVAGSRYRLHHEHKESDEFPSVAQEFAQKIVDDGFKPDVAFALDIGCVGPPEDIKQYGVIEINSFSCSGMYLCNRTAIVQAANELARKVWHDYWDDIPISTMGRTSLY